MHLRTSVARKMKSLAKDRRGQGLIEYALIILLVALAALTALIAFGGNNNNGILGPSVSAIANVEH